MKADAEKPERVTVKREDGRVAAVVEEVDGEVVVNVGPNVSVKTLPAGTLTERLHDGQLR